MEVIDRFWICLSYSAQSSASTKLFWALWERRAIPQCSGSICTQDVIPAWIVRCFLQPTISSRVLHWRLDYR